MLTNVPSRWGDPATDPWRSYGAAVGLAALVVCFRWLVDPILQEQAPLIALMAAPVLAALYGGLGPGILATFLCAALGESLFVLPRLTLLPDSPTEWVRLGIFLGYGLLFSWLIDARRAALLGLEQEKRKLLQLQAQLALQERRATETLEASPAGMVVVDIEGGVKLVNRQAEKLFGYAREELIGLSVDRLLPDAVARARAGFERDHGSFGTSRPMGDGRDLFARRKDGTVFPVAIGMSLVKDAEQTLVLASVLDVTERHRREQELLEAHAQLQRQAAEMEERVADRTERLTEANEDLAAYARTVAHDLRAPLRNIRGYADALLEDELPHLSEEGRRYLDRLAAGVARMDQLIVDLLQYSQFARAYPALEPIDVRSVLSSTMADLRAELQHATLIDEVPVGLPRDMGHPSTVAAVWANLLSNAAKFVKPGQTAVIRLSAEVTPDCVILCVEDSGIGIPAEHHDRIFGVFERLHGQEAYAGTGIGLAIVRKGVERMGGRVWVESLPQGSRFLVRLRRAEPGGAAAA